MGDKNGIEMEGREAGRLFFVSGVGPRSTQG